MPEPLDTTGPPAQAGSLFPSTHWSVVLPLRARYRALFREEVAHTVSNPPEVDDEISHPFAVLSR